MTFIKREQPKQAEPQTNEELLKVISENCSNEELNIFAKLVQNPLFKKLAIDYLKANLK